MLAQSWSTVCLLVESTWNCQGGSPRLKQGSLVLQPPSPSVSQLQRGQWEAELWVLSVHIIQGISPGQVPHTPHCSQCLPKYPLWAPDNCLFTLMFEPLLFLGAVTTGNIGGERVWKGDLWGSLVLYQPQNACQAVLGDVSLSHILPIIVIIHMEMVYEQ